jgi:4-amino-4-deoxy-L-arabinose transferase-like glycosyltransferase
LLAQALFRSERDRLTRAFLGLCAAIALQVLLMLVLHTLPGPLPWQLVLGSFDALALLFGLLLLRQHASIEPVPRQPYLSIALIVLLGALLRLPFLGSAEFQGDEANVVLLGVDAIIGHEEILLLHRKGPVEVLLPTGLLALMGQINEGLARLPFALVGLGVIVGAYLLGRRMLGSTLAGTVAAALLALDGFLIAFSRMVQYQNVVVLLMIGAIWCGWRFYEGSAHPQRDLLCGAVLAAVAGLAHYDGWSVLPALAWLLLAGAWRRGWRSIPDLARIAAPLVVYAALTASFYIPFVLHEHFQSTLHNLMKRTGQRGGIFELFNNLPLYERVATFYNTTFQIHWLGVLLAAAGVVWLWRLGRPRALGVALAALLVLGCGLLVWDPQRLALAGGGNWAIIAFAAPLAALILSPAVPPALRTLVIWFSIPFVAEAFLIVDPKTHFYMMDAAAALLIGLALAQLSRWLRERRLARGLVPLALGGVGLLALAVPYLYLVFVRQAPEYWNVFPTARPEIYRATYGDTLPANAGYFGLPHRAGWKVIGELYREGVLRGTFESNEDYSMTLWYLGPTPRCDHQPDYYFLSQAPLDPVKVPVKQIEQEYQLFGSVQVDGVKQIEIYSRQPVPQPARSFELRDYIDTFDARQVINLPDQRMVFDLKPRVPMRAYWQEGAWLERAEIRDIEMVAGQSTRLVFHWSATKALDPGVEVVARLINSEGRPTDGISPPCASSTPSEWHNHEDNTTSFTLSAEATIPPGHYEIQVGLRDTYTGAWLRLSDGSTTVTMGMLTVETR